MSYCSRCLSSWSAPATRSRPSSCCTSARRTRASSTPSRPAPRCSATASPAWACRSRPPTSASTPPARPAAFPSCSSSWRQGGSIWSASSCWRPTSLRRTKRSCCRRVVRQKPIPGLRADGVALHAQEAGTEGRGRADLDLPAQPPGSHRWDGLLHRTDRDLRCPGRALRRPPRPSARVALRIHPPPDGDLGSPATPRSLPLRGGPTLSHLRPRQHVQPGGHLCDSFLPHRTLANRVPVALAKSGG